MSIADQTNQFFEKFLKPLVALVVLALVASGAYSFYSKQRRGDDEKKANLLFEVKKELLDAEKSVRETADTSTKDKKKPAKAPDLSAKFKQAYEPVIPKFEAFIKANQGHVTAIEAALIVSKSVQEYKDESKELSVLQMGVKGVDKTNFLYGVAQSRIGELLYKQDKCSEAAKAWEDLITIDQHAYMSGSLRLKAGVCYEKIGMWDKAEAMYKKVSDEAPNSANGRMAKKFLLHVRYQKSKGAKAKEKTSAMNEK